jgi:predicted dehydrogenase
MGERVRVGIVGCGAISGNYLRNAANLPILEVTACADLELERAQKCAAEFGIPKPCSVDELMGDPNVDLVINLTIPAVHAALAQQALANGKHVYNEKPWSLDRAEGKALLDAVHSSGLRAGCAPDTVLGAGIQTARKAIDDGQIGRPVAFHGFMLGRGPERFHPNPGFFYQPGGGPMFDMGPYYLTALLNLLGPVKRIAGMAPIAIRDRTVATGPLAGESIEVNTSDHVCGLLEFENGAAGTLMTSFAVMNAVHDGKRPIVIYGTEGALQVPDPNTFDGTVLIRRSGEEEWSELPHAFPAGYGRSVGAADMAHALATGRPHRCNAEQAHAVLDLMQGFLDASASGKDFIPTIPYERPAPMPADLPFGQLD